MHTHWRDSEAWRREGLGMSTTSDEAVKLYDCALTQVVGRYEDDSMGGLESTMQKMIESDPNFVMGRVLKTSLKSLVTGEWDNRGVEKMILNKLIKGSDVTDRERRHAKATDDLLEGNISLATDTWESILVDHPTDICAIILSNFAYGFTGRMNQLRDSVARVLPHWTANTPLFGYLHGMLSFGYEETGFYDAAEKSAKKALSINKHDAWATHSLCHLTEMCGRASEGIQYLESTVDDWNVCKGISPHIYWHWALHHIEEGQYEEALTLFEEEMLKKGQRMPDMTSILLRLEMEGVDVTKQWQSLYDNCKNSKPGGMIFHDLPYVIAYAGAHENEAVEKFMQTIHGYISEETDTGRCWRAAGYHAATCLRAYSQHAYDDVIKQLQPIKYDLSCVGGSVAQRDLYNLILIHSAMRSHDVRNHRLAINLLNERKALRSNSSMTDRLITKALSTLNGQ